MPKKVTHRIEGSPAVEDPEGQRSQETTESPSPEGTPQAGSGTEADQIQEPGPYEYQNPMLRNRTPEEVERIFGMYEQASREQGARLTAAEKRVAALETQPAKVEPDPPVGAQEFFADPMAHVKRALNETVAPLREEIAEAKGYFRGQDARAALKAKYRDWDAVEPYIDHILGQANYPDPNDIGLLDTLYYTAKGIMVSQGINVQTETPTSTQEAPVRSEVPAVPPQHRASTPPPPPPRPAAPGGQSRELTETEKRLARESGLSPGEYIKWQEMDIDDVAMADFDQEKKNG